MTLTLRLFPKTVLLHRSDFTPQIGLLYWGVGEVLSGASMSIAVVGRHGGRISFISHEGEVLYNNDPDDRTFKLLKGLKGSLTLQGQSVTNGLFGRKIVPALSVVGIEFDPQGRCILSLPEGADYERSTVQRFLPCWVCGHATRIAHEENSLHLNVRHCQACTARVPTTWEEIELGVPTCHACEFPTEQVYCQRCGTKQPDQGQFMRYEANLRTP